MHRLGYYLLLSLSIGRGKCWQLSPDETAQPNDGLLPLTTPIIEDSGRLHMISQAMMNASVPGKSRGPRRRNKFGLLDARQDGVCTNPNFVLVCPATEHSPCCDPNYPVCCHDPSDTCCPSNTFCQGLQTCCINGATGCGEGCCVSGVPCCNNACCLSASYICDTSGSVPTCIINPALQSSTQDITSASQTTSHAIASSDPSQSSSPSPSPTAAAKSNNTAIIGGAVGGGVGALILIAFLAWWILKKPSNKTTTNTNGTMSNVPPTNYPSGTPNRPLMAPTPSAYHGSNGSPIAFAPHTTGAPTMASTSPPITSPATGNAPYRVSTYAAPSGGGGGMGTMGGMGMGMAAGAGAGMMAEAMNPNEHGGLGYVPPPPEHASGGDRPGVNYYANTPMPNPALSGYGGSSNVPSNYGSTYAPSTHPPSSPLSMSSTAPIIPISAVGYHGDQQPPWLQTHGSPPPTSPSPPHGAGTSFSPAPTSSYTPPPGGSTYTPPPPGAGVGPGPSYGQPGGTPGYNPVPHQGQQSFGSGALPSGMMSPPPGAMSPPPPFSPPPGGLGDAPGSGSGGGGGAGYAPWAIPLGSEGPNAGTPSGAYGAPAGSDGQGRTVPMSAPGDLKARFSGANVNR